MVYIYIIAVMTCVSVMGPIEYIAGRVGKDGDVMFPVLFSINIMIPVAIYTLVYYYGIENYNNKRLFIGSMTVIYLLSLIGQYAVLVRENKGTDCKYLFSSAKYKEISDTIYRFMYCVIMLFIPLYLREATSIMTWALFAPLLIPIFMYVSSFILGLGVSDGKNIIDTGDYYGAFVRGIDSNENYLGKGLMMNILRSVVRTIILVSLFVISYLASKRLAGTDRASPFSILLFVVVISSILPLSLGYLLEPKCLLQEAEKQSKGNTFVCYVFDKHGGIYMNLIYVLICSLIIIGKDN